ncbi:ASI1-immunoprecipitated protein 1-like protein [Drosera capensis]
MSNNGINRPGEEEDQDEERQHNRRQGSVLVILMDDLISRSSAGEERRDGIEVGIDNGESSGLAVPSEAAAAMDDDDDRIQAISSQHSHERPVHPNYLEPNNPACCALVELENEDQAKSVLEVLASYAFMMSGMPRPVRARPAEAEMFVHCPVRPGRRIQLYWVDPSDPDFEVAQTLKDLTKKHYAEAYLLKLQLVEEERLSKQQAETLKTSHQKYGMIDTILDDGTAKWLADHYRVNLADDGYGHF